MKAPLYILVECEEGFFLESVEQKLYCPFDSSNDRSFCGSWCPMFEIAPNDPQFGFSVFLHCCGNRRISIEYVE